MGTKMDTPLDPEDLRRIIRREAFVRRLKREARDTGYQIMFQNWSQGLNVHYRKAADLHITARPTDYKWKIANIHFTEMTDDKIKELLVRWRMGL